MGIKAKSGNKGVISNAVNEFQKRVEESAVFAFSALGEDLVKYAKSKHNYTDQTCNLTNSIGYVLLLHGNVRAVGGFVDSGKSPGLDKAMTLA